MKAPSREKQYQLIISIFASHHQAGAGISTNIFGPYDTMEECEAAAKEAKKSFVGYNGALYYACVPTYKNNYV